MQLSSEKELSLQADGWVTEPGALLTLMQLRGVVDGDELTFLRDDGVYWQGKASDEDAGHAFIELRVLYGTYSKLRGEPGERYNWTIVAWRRP